MALVTGAASGMGLAAAKAFAEAGAAVALFDVNEDAVRVAAEALAPSGHRVIAIRCGVAALVDQTVAELGRLDAAFNNAGVQSPVAETADADPKEYNFVMGVDRLGVWNCMTYELLQMRKQSSGAIVNNSSLGGLVGIAERGIYHASKRGVVGLTKSAGLEYAPSRLIDGALQGARRGASLTQRLLAFARRQDLAVEPTDLASLVANMQELLTRSVGSRIEIRTEIGDELPLALVDGNQVELALLNLLRVAEEAEISSSSVRGPRTILLVDDDALIAMSSVDMLEDLGHRVFEANSGRQALDILAENPSVDLMITDFSMPGMNGTELATAARALRLGLPILVASGYADLPAGVDIDLRRLGKPYTQQQPQHEISKLMA